jgi:hypothetical protein
MQKTVIFTMEKVFQIYMLKGAIMKIYNLRELDEIMDAFDSENYDYADELINKSSETVKETIKLIGDKLLDINNPENIIH